MHRFIKLRRILSLMSIIILVSCSSIESNETTPKIRIAVSSNMQFPLKEIADAFEAESGVRCELIIGSSGKLAAQIIEGAPFDLFVSADMKYPDLIHSRGLALNTPTQYGSGRLVLWTMDNNYQNLSIDNLLDKNIKHVAIANPRTAPYGKAAEEFLRKVKLYDQITSKLVFGESISQANQFITSGTAEIGFTSLSVVLSNQMKDKGKWIEIDPNLYSPINQGVVLLKKKNSVQKYANQFFDFLFTDKAKNILIKYGYNVDLIKTK